MYIDFHAHVLPGADHGSDSVATSLAQLQKAAAKGIHTIVATPHFYLQRRHTVEGFLARREKAFQALQEAMDEGSMTIIKAAEVTLAVGLETLPDLDQLCIEGTNYILLEMPMNTWTRWVYDTVYHIAAQRKLRPVIAHVDRYDWSAMLQLLDLGVYAQINASALVSMFRRKRYVQLIRENKVHVLGSDAHMEAKEYEAFAKAIKLLGAYGDRMMQQASLILQNKAF